MAWRHYNELRKWWNLASVPKNIRQEFFKKKHRAEIKSTLTNFNQNQDPRIAYKKLKNNSQLKSKDLQRLFTSYKNSDLFDTIIKHRDQLSQKEAKAMYETIRNNPHITSDEIQEIVLHSVVSPDSPQDKDFRDTIVKHRDQLSQKEAKAMYETIRNNPHITSDEIQEIVLHSVVSPDSPQDREFRDTIIKHRDELKQKEKWITVL